ncbi:MAG: sulfatase [Planctomycetes bacterium]|nr:sulfatase [Planctomycetota bacterium]MBI3844468.1 sulfatase [Planctomycetota bacterium]
MTSNRTAIVRILLSSSLLCAFAACGRPSSTRPDVILVTVESFRFDHVGCFGYGAARTPTLDDLARSGAMFEGATTQSCFTAPSMATISTGLFPVEHGVLQWGDRGDSAPVQNLSQVLSAAGYRTGFFGGHGALAGIHALARGFETFRDEPDRTADAIVEDAMEWLRKSDDPAFVWLHLFEPHAPYRPGESYGRPRVPSELRARLDGHAFDEWERLATSGEGSSFATRVAFLTSQYDGEIDRVDEALGALVDALRREARFERTHVIVFADHGENLGDHAPFFDHRDFLYDSLVHVPLVWHGPGIVPRRVVEPVGQVELAATILRVLDIADPSPRRSGRSFEDLLLGVPTRRDRDQFSDSGRQADPHIAIRAERFKLVRRLDDGRELLFDLRADPAELRDASSEHADEAQRLRARLDAWFASLTAAPRGDETLDAAASARLRALGYVR